MNKPIIKLENIIKNYDGKKNILEDINFSINRGEFAIIEGKSGAGKSTFLNILGLLDSPSEGNYYLDNFIINTKKLNSYSNIRAERIGFIFQAYQLIEKLSIEENILIPYLYMNKSIDNLVKRKIDEVLEEFNLLDMKKKEVSLLSGGEKQRVAIARAIVKDSDIIIADEPTGNLDMENSKIIVDTLKKLTTQNKAIVVVTHNPDYFVSADSKYMLQGGKLHKC